MFMLNDRIRFIDIFIENGFDVKVIVYIRRPVEFLASVWGERLKPCIPEKMQITLEQENDFYDIQFNTVLAFIDKIGAENVMVRPFEKEQWKNHSFVDDWLSCIGINTTEGMKLDVSRNKSYSRNTSEIFLLINRIDLPIERTQHYKKRIADITADNQLMITETLTDEYIELVTERYRPILKEIADKYGKDNIFLNEYPSCYNKKNLKFDKVIISMEQMEIISQALNEKTRMKTNNISNQKRKGFLGFLR